MILNDFKLILLYLPWDLVVIVNKLLFRNICSIPELLHVNYGIHKGCVYFDLSTFESQGSAEGKKTYEWTSHSYIALKSDFDWALTEAHLHPISQAVCLFLFGQVTLDVASVWLYRGSQWHGLKMCLHQTISRTGFTVNTIRCIFLLMCSCCCSHYLKKGPECPELDLSQCLFSALVLLF